MSVGCGGRRLSLTEVERQDDGAERGFGRHSGLAAEILLDRLPMIIGFLTSDEAAFIAEVALPVDEPALVRVAETRAN